MTDDQKVALLAGITVAIDQVTETEAIVSIARVFNRLTAKWNIPRPAGKPLRDEVILILAGAEEP